MSAKNFYSRDLRGFLLVISPLTFFVRKSISEQIKPFSYSERQALLVLLDLIELKIGDMAYDLHDNDVSNANKRVQEQRMRDYLHRSGHDAQRRRRDAVERGESPKTEHNWNKPLQDRFGPSIPGATLPHDDEDDRPF